MHCSVLQFYLKISLHNPASAPILMNCRQIRPQNNRSEEWPHHHQERHESKLLCDFCDLMALPLSQNPLSATSLHPYTYVLMENVVFAPLHTPPCPLSHARNLHCTVDIWRGLLECRAGRSGRGMVDMR
jgi:hypothetical protein